ncbi:MAG: tetratricopeptide repeat protein [Candidatus Omnitrophica bacterium]|nr:tetratricopeptide repeat protein [Candidatus Omnitrophota bacterium]
MTNRVFLKNILPLILSLVLAIVFFVSYNRYLLDRSLTNLKVSLKSLEKTTDVREVGKIKDILDETFLLEITKDDLDVATLVKIELSSETLGKSFKNDQIRDVNYLLKDVVKKKEEKRNPFLAALDSFFTSIFPQKRSENITVIKRHITRLTRVLPSYTGDALQEKCLEIARLYIRTKDWGNARTFFDRAALINPDNQLGVKAKLYLGFVYKFEGDYARAGEIFAQLKGKLSGELGSFSSYQEGDCLYKEGKIDEAIKVFRASFAENPALETNQLSQFRVGYINLYDVGDEQQAYKDFAVLESLSIDNQGNAYLTRNGKKIYEGFLSPSALLSYNKLAAHINENVIPSISKKFRELGFKALERGYRLLRKGKRDDATMNFREALTQLGVAIKFYSQDAFSYSGRGLAFYFLENNEEALQETRKANSLLPDNSAILANLGFVYYNLGMIDDAVVEYKKAIVISPGSSLLHYNIGTIYLFKNDVVKAISELKEAIKLNPQFPYSYNNLGYLLWLKGAYKEAKVHLEKAVGLKKDYVDAHYNLGVLYFTLGDNKAAKDEFTIVEELMPGYKMIGKYVSALQERERE